MGVLFFWNSLIEQYIPLKEALANGQLQPAVIHQLDGRGIVVYYDLPTGLPGASSARWHGDQLDLSHGEHYRAGVVYKRQSVERPLQLAMRWYGFAYKFPNCEVFA